MKGAKAKLYIRFGDIPEDQLSKVHRGDQEVRSVRMQTGRNDKYVKRKI